jgi:hypothetical protein
MNKPIPESLTTEEQENLDTLYNVTSKYKVEVIEFTA